MSYCILGALAWPWGLTQWTMSVHTQTRKTNDITPIADAGGKTYFWIDWKRLIEVRVALPALYVIN